MGWTCVIIALLVISTRSQAQHYGQQYQTPKRVLLSEVRSLTLSKGQVTAGRRSSPVQQTSCIGGSGCGTSAEPAIIQCINQGSDGVDFQWKCTADLPGDYRFGETTVTCEGFEYADDPYVLAGSCGVEYTLERRLGMSGSHDQTRYFGSNQQYHYDWDNYDTESSWSVGGILAWVVLGLVVYRFYSWLVTPTFYGRANNGGQPWGGDEGPGGGGGFGGGGYPGTGPNCQANAGAGGGNNFWWGMYLIVRLRAGRHVLTPRKNAAFFHCVS
eukprot:m.445142 g.445142  ORF g.445142 m.445142 type:complete len:271 (+) comp21491_c0_seq8:321-1133(+)